MTLGALLVSLRCNTSTVTFELIPNLLLHLVKDSKYSYSVTLPSTDRILFLLEEFLPIHLPFNIRPVINDTYYTPSVK